MHIILPSIQVDYFCNNSRVIDKLISRLPGEGFESESHPWRKKLGLGNCRVRSPSYLIISYVIEDVGMARWKCTLIRRSRFSSTVKFKGQVL